MKRNGLYASLCFQAGIYCRKPGRNWWRNHDGILLPSSIIGSSLGQFLVKPRPTCPWMVTPTVDWSLYICHQSGISHTHSHWTIWPGQLLSWTFLFPADSGLGQFDSKTNLLNWILYCTVVFPLLYILLTIFMKLLRILIHFYYRYYKRQMKL